MLYWLQSTLLRWAVESLAQQLVAQLFAATMGETQPKRQLAAQGSKALCRACGRRVEESPGVGRRRSRSAKRPQQALSATRRAGVRA